MLPTSLDFSYYVIIQSLLAAIINTVWTKCNHNINNNNNLIQIFRLLMCVTSNDSLILTQLKW